MEIKQKYPIDFAKGITWLIIIGLIYYFNQSNNLTAWIYFCLHGSYGIMWVMKSNIFPDKTWEKKAGIPYTMLIIFGLMMCGSAIRFWSNGWIDSFFLKPKHFFHYYGFSWIKPPKVLIQM